MTVQQNRIAIITIIGPRHNHISRAPCRATSSATEGSGMRNIAALPVPGILHIVKPFPVKLGHIERQDRTFHDYLRVSGIGQPLPVRTVTADTTVEVIFLRSQVNLVDLVKQFVRTTETSGRPWISMHDFCHQTFPAHPDLSGYNFDIAKRMPSETRLPLFYSTTPQCIKVHLPEIILLLSDKAELYPVSGIALHLYMRPAWNHLRKCIPISRIIFLFAAYRLQYPDNFLMRGKLCMQAALRCPHQKSFLPGRILIPVPVPAVQLQPGIIFFTCKYGVMQ